MSCDTTTRQPTDGEVRITRLDNGRIRISVDEIAFSVSEFNARRLLGLLSLLLELPLSGKAQKAIRL